MATATIARPAQAMRRSRPSLSTRYTTLQNQSATSPNTLSSAVPAYEPLVRDTPHILRKFNGNKPSLVVHLHPTFFRFDQQEGSFPYDSAMRCFIEHMQDSTVPHDLIEELVKNGTTFYDG